MLNILYNYKSIVFLIIIIFIFSLVKKLLDNYLSLLSDSSFSMSNIRNKTDEINIVIDKIYEALSQYRLHYVSSLIVYHINVIIIYLGKSKIMSRIRS